MYIVGAGPGDPDLITVKGEKMLREADVVVYTDSLIAPALIEKAKPEAELVKSAGLTLEEIIDVMVQAVQSGKNVVRLHTGDPSVFGAILEQMALLHQLGIDSEVVPGVSAVFASAAAAGVELTVPELTQTVILTRAEGRTPMPEREKLRELASHHCTIALFLSATLVKHIVNEFREAGWEDDTPVLVVYRATWPDEKIVRTTLAHLHSDMRKYRITKQAMVIAGKAVDPRLKLEGGYESKLYDKTFTHSYRKGVTVDG